MLSSLLNFISSEYFGLKYLYIKTNLIKKKLFTTDYIFIHKIDCKHNKYYLTKICENLVEIQVNIFCRVGYFLKVDCM